MTSWDVLEDRNCLLQVGDDLQDESYSSLAMCYRLGTGVTGALRQVGTCYKLSSIFLRWVRCRGFLRYKPVDAMRPLYTLLTAKVKV